MRPAAVCASLLAMFWSSASCAQETDALEVQRTYEVGPVGTEEILSLASFGGQILEVPHYRLFGDGLLVREIVSQADRDRVFKTDKVTLAQADVDPLFQRIVESGLAEVTNEKIRSKLGGKPLDVEDDETLILELHFESYSVPGQRTEIPFTPRVEIHAPGVQADLNPAFREAEALLTLRKALDEYFEVSAFEVIHGPQDVLPDHEPPDSEILQVSLSEIRQMFPGEAVIVRQTDTSCIDPESPRLPGDLELPGTEGLLEAFQKRNAAEPNIPDFTAGQEPRFVNRSELGQDQDIPRSARVLSFSLPG